MRTDSAGRIEFLLKEIQESDREGALGFPGTPGNGGVDDEVGGGVGFGRGR